MEATTLKKSAATSSLPILTKTYIDILDGGKNLRELYVSNTHTCMLYQVRRFAAHVTWLCVTVLDIQSLSYILDPRPRESFHLYVWECHAK